MREDLTEFLPEWLAKQRWFAGKGRPIASTAVESDIVVEDWEPVSLHALVIRVDYVEGPCERYSVLVGARHEAIHRLEYGSIAHFADGEVIYDALHDTDLMGAVLRRIAEQRSVDGLTFARLQADEQPAPITTDLPNRLNTTEQSNSSVIYGDTYILKLFRRVAPGINPDLEISRALALAGSAHVAPPLGWIEGSVEGETATLGLLQPFFTSATEAWTLATTSVRDLYAEADLHADEVGGDFAGESARLGVATAEVHADLARALGAQRAEDTYLRSLGEAMISRLQEAVEVVPDLRPYQDRLSAAFLAVEDLPEPLTLQRIHGDFHLGQALRVDNGWILLDFEGEPVKSLAERRRPDSPLRDVAGMLRSFDYAARFLLADRPRNATLEFRATEWAQRNRDAFCDGYAEAAGPDPRDCAPLLRAYELDKAVYEVVYEARHRPAWQAIPLNSIERLVAR
ncbi:MAG: aminoglycoside phosphotransferase [Frankiaceae bacterium]